MKTLSEMSVEELKDIKQSLYEEQNFIEFGSRHWDQSAFDACIRKRCEVRDELIKRGAIARQRIDHREISMSLTPAREG